MLSNVGNKIKDTKGLVFLERLKYGLYLITHPIDGFWDLNRAKRGGLGVAFCIAGLFFLSVLCKRQLTEWYFGEYYTLRLNVLSEFFTQLGPYALWCVSSWCITSLMDGEGTIKDITMATCYSLIPLVLANFVYVLLSYMLTGRENLILQLVAQVGVVWSYGLIFLSVVVTHQYTVAKSVLVTVLSLLGIVVIMCLGLLVFYLVQQLVGFALDVFKEFSLRIAE
jgi:hypothetical protein